MYKPILFVVHGMGNPQEDWEESIVQTLNDQLLMYPAVSNSIRDHVDIVPINYNEKFEEQRALWQGQAEGVADKLSPDYGATAQMVSYIQSLQSQFSEDKFFNTHVLDILLYRFTFIGERVRAHIALQIATALKDRAGVTNVTAWNVLAYSLGTKAISDTLHQMHGDNDWLVDATGGRYSGGFSRAKNLFQIANVSRALQTDTLKAYKSKVRPGPGGVCEKMFNCSHHFDPFAQLLKYEPLGDLWPPKAIDHYTSVEIGLIGQKNIHDLEHYLQHPHCHAHIFKRLIGWRSISNSDIDNALEEHKARTISFDSVSLREKLNDLKNGKLTGFSDYFKLLKVYSDIID